jgi:hypothetical protein
VFCRHNRLEANCSICQREKQAARPSAPPRRAASSTRHVSARKPAGSGTRTAGRLVTKRLARAADDGFASTLAPGLRATADAERLATAIAVATGRLAFPGPHPAVAEAMDVEQGHWLAFLLALAGPDKPELQQALVAAAPMWGEETAADDGLGDGARPAIAAYRQWIAKSGGTQQAAVAGIAAWTPAKRFARTFDRLSFPGFGRAARFEFLLMLGAAGLHELEADALHVSVATDDATTLAAKRALNSGDAILLERRAAELAEAAGVPIGALDRGFALWDRTGPLDEPGPELLEPVRAALGLA